MTSAAGTAPAADTGDVASCSVAEGPGSVDAATIENDLGWALGTVFRAYRRAAGDVLNALPGGPRGYQVLATAVRDGARPQAVLAAHLGVDRTVMTYLLDDLEKAGVIARQPDPDDRRVHRVTATSRGRKRLAQMDSRLRGAERHLLSRLGDADADVFRTLLQRLACSAGDDTDVAGCPTGAASPCDVAPAP